MKIVTVAVIFGAAMFVTNFALVAVFGTAITFIYDVEFNEMTFRFLAKKSLLAGCLAGVSSFLYVFFGSHRRIGR